MPAAPGQAAGRGVIAAGSGDARLLISRDTRCFRSTGGGAISAVNQGGAPLASSEQQDEQVTSPRDRTAEVCHPSPGLASGVGRPRRQSGVPCPAPRWGPKGNRSEEHTSELQSPSFISYAV